MATSTAEQLPTFMQWAWADIEPQYTDLERAELTIDSVAEFLTTWSELGAQVSEMGDRLRVQTTRNTADGEATGRLHSFLEDISPNAQQAEQRLKEKLLASGLEPLGMEVPLRQMRTDAALFREENIPLQIEDQKLSERYFQITGAQMVEWEGEQITTPRVRTHLQNADRAVRERAWRAMTERQLQDRGVLNDLWQQFLLLRLVIARNAGFDDVRAYMWQALHRFDYTPQDVKSFHQAVEEEVVPALRRMYQRRQKRLGSEALRPWDLEVDPLGRPPLRPFQTAQELQERTAAILHRVDPQIGGYFDTLCQEGYLDLESRNNKAPGAYCQPLEASHRPFIFANAVGSRLDVEALLHEGGHAVHVFETANLPYRWQRSLTGVGMEFAEVGSMAMEYLGAPYLSRDHGWFYSPEDAARARIEHLEQQVLLLWCRLAVTDVFQHWVYENPTAGGDPAQCDAIWSELTRRFVPDVEWTGLEDQLHTGWHNILHIFVAPFYVIEYALAQLGAIQVWANAREDEARAIRQYRAALALGATRPLPELFAAAGARFAFDAETLRRSVSLVEETIAELERA